MTRSWPRRGDLGAGYDIPALALASALESWVDGSPRPVTWAQFAAWAEQVRGRKSDTTRVSIWAATWEQQLGEMLEATRRRIAPTSAEMMAPEVDPIDGLLARVRGAA